MRNMLFSCLVKEMTERLTILRPDAKRRESMEKLGWLKGEDFQRLKWDAKQKKTVQDTETSVISYEDVLAVLQSMMTRCNTVEALLRFHPTRPITEQMQEGTVAFLLQFSLQNDDGLQLYADTSQLCHCGSTMVCGIEIKKESSTRSQLANQIRRAASVLRPLFGRGHFFQFQFVAANDGTAESAAETMARSCFEQGHGQAEDVFDWGMGKGATCGAHSDFQFSSCTLARNVCSKPHRDSYNAEGSWNLVVPCSTFQGGEVDDTTRFGTRAGAAEQLGYNTGMLDGLPERRFEALDGEVQRLDGRLQQMTLQFLSSATSDDLSRVASRLAQTELQVPETHTTELHQLQKELGTVTGELGASRARLEAAVAEKQVLEARLAEALQDVEEARKQREEKGWEAAEAAASANREMARQRSESDEKYRLLEKEHSSVRDKLQSALSELAQAESQKKVLELQVETKCQQLTDLEERQERELAAQAEKLEQTQVEVDRLTTELSKASQGSPAEEFKSVAEELRPRSESENDGSEKDRKIQELQAQLDEVSQQLNQVQAELEQRSIEAAEALVDIGQDVDAIEWESGQRGRKLEAQIAEITEMEKDAEETVEALSEELDRCNAKLAASENKRRELEYHLEDTSAKLTSVQDELAQCQIDTAQALTAASDDLALLKAESEAEIRRLRALLEDSDGSDLLSPQHLLLPSQEGLSPKSGTGSVQSSAGNSVWT
ncbi:unnamed protein product [Symbiodinium sp. KB8]|nr:unnamed protein product [Symbiodinium sp. KB8]